MEVRTRFAPSPTGFLHVGNVRAALFPWLVARQAGGVFVLRVEDTDRAREVQGALEVIRETLGWLDITWDEGPYVGGPYGPYLQTERQKNGVYTAWAQKLIDKGYAYADPYSPEEVQAFRDEAKAAKQPFLYRNYRPENPPIWDGSQPLRFKVKELKTYTWHDEIMGDLSAGPETLDDFILIKSDGFPTYNFAHIVDDFDMRITHVIRGLEYLPSMSKYLSLYEALEIPTPIFAHAPHIMNPDGKKKLGKRDGAKSILDYKEQGFMPEVMLNFLASMGWNDGTNQELFRKQELIDTFSLDRVQRSGARFDEQRLIWMQGTYVRTMDSEKLYKLLSEWKPGFWPKVAFTEHFNEAYRKKVLSLVQERLKFFSELPQLTLFFFEDLPVDSNLWLTNKQLKKCGTGELKSMLEQAKLSLLESNFTEKDLTDRLNTLLESTGQKPGVLFSLIRIATTQAPASPPLAGTMAVLGKETVERRINQTLAAL